MHFMRILEAPVSSFFLFGPRGVGKSTWARQTFPLARRIDLLDETLFQRYAAYPGLFADELRALEPGAWVVVDEVQRLPALLNEVHRSIEERGHRFVLLGSSARKLKTQGTNLLAGRAVRRTMYPLLPEEMGAAFDLQEVLQFGSIPLVWNSLDRADTLDAYVRMYLAEEIRAEAVVRNLPGFLRFLPVAAIFHGQSINTSALARDAGAARATVEGYLSILEDTLLAFRLPPFETRLRARERRHPKLYWIDPGLVRAVKHQQGAPTAEERGALFEGWVAVLLRAYAETRKRFDSISHWSSGAKEVDFVVTKGEQMAAIEVKATSNYHTGLLQGLRAFPELPGLTKKILVYQGDRRLKTTDGIDVLPVMDFAEWVQDWNADLTESAALL